ncbi:M1 family metallopeptidase [Croceibacterium sp. LX-88]|uniref:Aminopeptidase n=1 Tax=Croceibacterium selenioxidans TaxID=2838833 RepID=A0ABS5W721_9SPHN|nr:M1 family metallopeptidase [Croceibacterium selenioxidans]MBT2135484.1 M1 family metallopeptidase [Croceibacterium selenioxidans]
MKRTAANVLAALLLAGSTLTSAPVALAQAVTLAPLPESVPSDLPRTARPIHYSIHIEPDAQKLTFTGTQDIELEVFMPVDALTLHALELEIGRAELSRADGTGRVDLTPKIDAEAQTVRLSAPAPIGPGTYRVHIEYTGKINTQAMGLFALDYPDKRTGETVRGLFTQFEAPDARRFAPMFDEPSYKATFNLSATVPAGQLAIGNMPVASEKTLPDGRKLVTFATTPKMSSYLLFFALGDFERLSAKGPGGVDLGIVSPTGSGEQARYSLDMMAPLIAYYTDYFGVPYPLPKLDNIAAPGESQFFGAMENWGAILTFEKYLLDDPSITSPATRNYIYTAGAHEIAHQWFGDIVTMAWWDDLWLNEGFASWMETKAAAKFNPDWYPLITRVTGRETAMGYDGFATTHPVIQPIRTVSETNQAFDAISYSKGEAVISMLEAYAGEDVWREGIRTYIQRHRYGNTTSEDLWRAVEEAGAANLVAVARDFTLQPGIPLVKAEAECREGVTHLTLTQGEFSRDRKDEVAAKPQRWRVPLLIQAQGAEPKRVLLEGSASLDLPGCGAVVVNGGQLGYFRTLYSPAMSAQLAKAMPGLDPIDQLGLVRDSLALAEAGYQPLALGLDMLAAVPGEANPVVAEGVVARWGAIHRVASEADQPAVAKAARDIWLPRLEQLGFDAVPDESLADTQLRVQLLNTLGNMNDPTVIAEGRRRLALLADNPKALDGPLKTTWLAIAARNATAEEWDKLSQLAANAPSAVERQAYYRLLGTVSDKALAQRALDFALTGKAGTSSATIIAAVSEQHPDLAFDFAIANRAGVEALLDSGGRPTYISGLANTSRDPAMVGKLESFSQSVPADERRPVQTVIASLKQRLESEPKMRAQVGEWLAANPD